MRTSWMVWYGEITVAKIDLEARDKTRDVAMGLTAAAYKVLEERQLFCNC